jgi:hypothetical protein
MILMLIWLVSTVILWSLAFFGIETNRTLTGGIVTLVLCSLWPLVIIGAVIAVIGENRRVFKKPMR